MVSFFKGGYIMKKWYLVFVASLLLLLTACGGETNEAEKDAEKSNKDEKVEESKISLEEVFEKTIERQKEVKSVSATMKMDQKMNYESTDGDSFDASSQMNMKMDMVNDPLAMYMKGTMGYTDSDTGESETIEAEMYMAENAVYMFENESKQWLKMPVEYSKEVFGSATQAADTAKQLETLKQFIKDFKLEETDKYYVLKMNAGGDEFKQFLMEQLEANSGVEFTEEDQEVIKQLEYKKLEYVINIDKKNFDFVSMDMIVELVTEADGEKMTIAMDSKTKFTNYNGVKSIDIPQEVIDQAVDIADY